VQLAVVFFNFEINLLSNLRFTFTQFAQI
jgi:hypothetical protein